MADTTESVQSVEATDEDTESDKASKGQSVLPAMEASVAALIASVAAYVLAHFWLKSYLGYFLIDQAIIQVDLQTVIFSGCSFLGGIGLIWGMYAGFPASIGALIIGLFFAFRASILPVSLFLLSFIPYGYNWFSVTMGIISIILLLVEMLYFRSVWKEEGSIPTALFSIVQTHVDYGKSKSIDGKISTLIGDAYINVFLLVGLLPYIFGTISGVYMASHKADFMSLEDDGERYLVVYSQADFVLMAQYEDASNINEVTLTGVSKKVGVDFVGGEKLEFKRNIRIVSDKKVIKRRTFSEFWSGLFSEEADKRRP